MIGVLHGVDVMGVLCAGLGRDVRGVQWRMEGVWEPPSCKFVSTIGKTEDPQLWL